MTEAPRWLQRIERKLGWIAIPHISVLLVTLQALGFLMVLSDPVWLDRLALYPSYVSETGEYWRVLTFLALPITMSPFWVLFQLWFLYFIVETIENRWGAVRTTLYVLVSILLTIAVSFSLDLPVTQATDFQSTLFLAAAALFPETVIYLFFAVPVKMKWLGWLALGFLGLRLVQSDWTGRIYLLAIYSNFLLFFGPALVDRWRQAVSRWNFRRKLGQ